MTVDAGAPRLATLPSIPWHRRLYGLGSIYGKTLRDSRLGVLIVGGVLGFMVLAGGAEMTSAYGTLAARRELDALATTLPPVMRGLYGNPLNVGTIGGFVSWHYGAYLTLLAGLWSILALSSTLAGEARRGSLDLAVAAPLPRALIAIEKLAGHVTALLHRSGLHRGRGLGSWRRLRGVPGRRDPARCRAELRRWHRPEGPDGRLGGLRSWRPSSAGASLRASPARSSSEATS